MAGTYQAVYEAAYNGDISPTGGGQVLWGIGDEVTGSPPSAQTTAIYTATPSSFGLLSAWFNGPGDLGFFTAVSRSSIDAIYASGKSIEVIIWLAASQTTKDYAISSTFLDTDLPAIVNAYKGAGTTYFCLFTELETMYDKATLAGRQYRDALKTQYIKAYQKIHSLNTRAKVGLGFTGQFWSGPVGTTRNLRYYENGQGSAVSGSTNDNAVVVDAYTSANALDTYSDILWSQQMQGAVTYETGTTQSLLVNQIINEVRQFHTLYPSKSIGISHFKVWDDPKSGGAPVAGADINAQNTWGSIMDSLFTTTQFNDLANRGLSVWNFMTDHYINLPGPIQVQTVNWLSTHSGSDVVAPTGTAQVVAKTFPRHLPSMGFGFTPSTDNTQLYLTLDRMVADGATWIRYDVSWAGYSPTARNAYDATYQAAIDLAVNEAYVRGIKVCLQVSNTPAWAAVGGAATGIAPVLNATDFQGFVNYIVTRYKGKIQAIMGWDKPAYAAYFSGTVAQMVTTQQALFNGAKAADVSITVASPATDGVDTAWWTSFYAAGGRGTFDVAAVSPYNVPSDDPPEAIGGTSKLTAIPDLRTILDANGDNNKKIWLAQFGWSAHTNTGTEATYQRGVTNTVQSIYFARSLEYIRSLPYVEIAFWTRLVDYTPTTDLGQIQAANRGFIETDYTFKDALRALQVYGFVQPERLLKRWDFRNGPGEWFLVTATPGGAAYPIVNNEKQLYTPAAWTFNTTGAHCQAYKTGTQWNSGMMNLRRILDFVGSCRVRFRWRGPRVKGAWPSCYLMPRPVVASPNQTARYGPWPSSGEMDAMEAGHSTHPGMISGTVHLDDPLGSGFNTGHIQLPAVGTNFKTCDWSQYHVCTFDWILDSNTIMFKWYLDDVLWQTVTNAPHQPFPFEQPFYPILNMAWGGDYPGDPDATTPLSGNFMDIDFFEVYSLGGTALPPGTITDRPPTDTGGGITDPVPVGPTGQWNLVFQDEFAGTTLDTSKWTPNWFGEGGSMNNVGTYAANSTVSGGTLNMVLSSSTAGALVHSDYSAGRYQLQVGHYAEARIYFPGTAGETFYNWPGWWSSGPNWPTAGEHDIVEGLGGDPTSNYHWGTVGTDNADNSGTIAGTWNNAFHTYGVHRKAASADVYWDGQLIRSYATHDNGAPQELIINVGKSNSRTPQIGTAGMVKVDYVRAWSPA
jgi:hypothetical protein